MRVATSYLPRSRRNQLWFERKEKDEYVRCCLQRIWMNRAVAKSFWWRDAFAVKAYKGRF
uniref:AlNc14C368G11076 protein n=1 Tax=Albugo laibachii Nc14 TaxID=890382 RepID=F0WY30_9STRA|nr:AlNc14C368G11076 [Albugo laibachii Nc14]|eukprot:CCA26379.1 AlNc14C368G11076 [Albugo laibachii Nc14]